ncbi:MAG: hypothetical protein DWB99_08140 [Candidatus Poseidoniales archaeon]|nr:MAG: hypothetical protein DWB99_08140 [Candidatus Poseidoniales archaeon]|tara:strand:+ start:229 stop:477 length:249 start_codon:yes stop_codon:yes gene_type:complete
MENEYLNEKELKFSDLIEINNHSPTPSWRLRCTTKIAHPSGRIPSLSAAAGWQPVFSPSERPLMSATINNIIRRVRKSRGEA